MSKGSKRETNAIVLKQAMIRRLPRRLSGHGEMALPPVPGLLEHYVKIFDQVWEGMGRKFNEKEIDEFRQALKLRLEQAFKISSTAKVVVTYSTDPPPKTSITWKVVAMTGTFADEYQHWTEVRTPPLFGKHADAKAIDVAATLGTPSEVAIVDIGAGTGRNTIPLAQLGYQVDAVEPTPALVKILKETVEKEKLPINVVEGDILNPELQMPRAQYNMVFLSEVVASHFRTVEQIRQLFERARDMLVPGGLLVFNLFLSDSGYKADDIAKQLSQVLWCALFSRHDLEVASQGLPFRREADESAAEYEKTHLPEGQYPPTGWYEGWCSGQDLFDLPPEKPPMELRWVVYRKTS